MSVVAIFPLADAQQHRVLEMLDRFIVRTWDSGSGQTISENDFIFEDDDARGGALAEAMRFATQHLEGFDVLPTEYVGSFDAPLFTVHLCSHEEKGDGVYAVPIAASKTDTLTALRHAVPSAVSGSLFASVDFKACIQAIMPDEATDTERLKYVVLTLIDIDG